MSKGKETLAIVVVNFGSHALIARNIDADATDDATVVIVDNFHSDTERSAIGRLCSERGWQLVPMPDNEGFGKAVNAGVATAISLGCRVVMLLNPDATASATVRSELAAEALRNPKALVAPRIVDSAGGKYFAGSTVNLTTGEIRGGWIHDGRAGPWHNWLTGACLVFHVDAFRAIGGMSEEYFLYWEDVDFSLRAAKAGVALLLRTDLCAVHDEGGTQQRGGSEAKSSLYYYYNARNRLIFGDLHGAEGSRFRWLVETPRQSCRIWLRGGRRQVLESPRGLAAAISGTIAGLGFFLGRNRRGRNTVVDAAGSARPDGLLKDPGGSRTVLVAHPGAELYGSDRMLLESVTALVSSGHRVVLTLPGPGPLVAAATERGADVRLCPSPVVRKSALGPRGLVRLAGEAFTAARRGRRLIRAVRPDLIVVNTVVIPLWLGLARFGRIPAVCHVHEAEASQPLLVRRLLYGPLLLANRLIVNSQFALDTLAGSWGFLRRRSIVVYNGVSGPDPMPSEPRVDVTDGPRLLFIGRLSPRKGPQVAIAALADLKDRGLRARLGLLGAVFDGYEWFETELRNQASELGLIDDIDFFGFDSVVWPYFEQSDIVCVPSTVDEPFGNTAVEAMLAQRPLVVSATSGLREAAHGFDSVRFVPPGDAGALADAVMELAQQWPVVREQVVGDRQSAQSRYSPASYQQAFRKALSLD